VVLEGWTSDEASETENAREDVLVISARTEPALRELAERYAQYLETEEKWNWAEICHTAGTGRAVFAERLAVVALGKREAAAQLRVWLRGEGDEVLRGHVGAGVKGEAVSAAEPPAQLAEGFVRGALVDWSARYAQRKLRRAQLPAYAFQRERYWIEEKTTSAESGEATGRGMLGRRLRVAGMRAQYESRVSSASWVGEHVVGGRVILPATGHMELMLEA
jgi:acyl transferase domain-containing protein